MKRPGHWIPDHVGTQHLVTGPGSATGDGAMRAWSALCGVSVAERRRFEHCPTCLARLRDGQPE